MRYYQPPYPLCSEPTCPLILYTSVSTTDLDVVELTPRHDPAQSTTELRVMTRCCF